jgi:hypothetical protein
LDLVRRCQVKVPRVFTALLLVVGVAAPCAAADHARPSLITLSKASEALLVAADHDLPLRSNQQPTPASTGSGEFFRSKKGATVVSLLVAGFAYTLYSRFHDEIKSPIREQ